LNDSTDKSSFSTDDYGGKNQFVELYADMELGKHFKLLQGADYRYSSYNSRFFSKSSFGPFESRFRDTAHSQASLYASLFFHALGEKLNIELGGRMNVHSEYGSNHTMTFNPSYTINEHFRAFGSIATAFKAPSLYQLYGNFVGNIRLQPEKAKTYELGLEQHHSKISNRLVYFHRDIKNGIDYNYVTFKYFNFYRQTVDGLEWETKVKPLTDFTITANYTFLSGEEKTQSRENFKDTTYNYLLRRPEHQLNLNASYQFNNGLYVSAGGNMLVTAKTSEVIKNRMKILIVI
jgi:vitamin B12 transporter